MRERERENEREKKLRKSVLLASLDDDDDDDDADEDDYAEGYYGCISGVHKMCLSFPILGERSHYFYSAFR